VPQKQEIEAPTAAEITEKPNADPKKKKYLSWATLLARVFDIDILTCPDCQGKLKIVTAIMETGAIKRILGHLGLPDKPPNIAPSRFSPQFDFS
jgi:hypothetical protein